MKYFSKAISYILHPLFMPLLGLYILFESPTLPDSLKVIDALYYFPSQAKNVLYVVIGILTLLAPVLSLLIMFWNKMITSLELRDRKERFYPFILVFFYFVLSYGYLASRLPDFLQHPALMAYIFGVILTLIISFILNFYIKISLHALGIFGVCGMLLAYNQSQIDSNSAFLFYLLCVGGLVAGARIYLKAHTLKETLLGMAIGFFVLFITVKYQIYI
jgi:membrane-associated phospholipid phosphatase